MNDVTTIYALRLDADGVVIGAMQSNASGPDMVEVDEETFRLAEEKLGLVRFVRGILRDLNV